MLSIARETGFDYVSKQRTGILKVWEVENETSVVSLQAAEIEIVSATCCTSVTCGTLWTLTLSLPN
jgi:hypothetical protein